MPPFDANKNREGGNLRYRDSFLEKARTVQTALFDGQHPIERTLLSPNQSFQITAKDSTLIELDGQFILCRRYPGDESVMLINISQCNPIGAIHIGHPGSRLFWASHPALLPTSDPKKLALSPAASITQTPDQRTTITVLDSSRLSLVKFQPTP